MPYVSKQFTELCKPMISLSSFGSKSCEHLALMRMASLLPNSFGLWPWCASPRILVSFPPIEPPSRIGGSELGVGVPIQPTRTTGVQCLKPPIQSTKGLPGIMSARNPKGIILTMAPRGKGASPSKCRVSSTSHAVKAWS